MIHLRNSFTETLKALDAAASIQGVLLTSEFAPKVFSAGLDFNEVDNATQEDFKDYWLMCEKMWKAWYGTQHTCGTPLAQHAPKRVGGTY
ncbi:hypothetical protein SARC_10903 [Sphaeroforma arctica JP610]|uniref:Uncharacterized protein n=1 Tax=Sphaeroforma arctica JP610 TaxID=667725 RepID=A0A0L0FIK7_9EUKA|nr:hypothetical protein SARC_10903 [Sphaeroforma arctica JP610]KNC76607.1 hypothetical protein SARC_10903 [Sphaeroforma arctica JP610]|eukprot:XP_014150509.1 hypothetical protein SARC_10903 [Sphaeroforma arctica JP610]